MTTYYVGITIGPIIETLLLASRPASLWCASAMFSWLSEDICNRALRIGGDIISPYYPNEKSLEHYSVVSEGVGKYHDRIIFKLDAENIDTLKVRIADLIEDSKEALADELVSEQLAEKSGVPKEELEDVLKKYLQIHYIIEEKSDDSVKNCILRLSPYLDAAELCPTFKVNQTIQPIATLFEGKDDEHHNNLVKLCFEIENGNTSVFDKNKKVRDIESIANSDTSSDRKIFNYYAVVQADGDSMGRLLSSFDSDEKVKKFSKQCLNYTTAAAQKIVGFGGMTIYAGGDDLLFISPLENQQGKTVFELCTEIGKTFAETFEDSGVTLSFGISVNYKHFPLYEAFKDALHMLETAKSVKTDDEVKNKTAIHIRKASGQSVKFRFTNQGVIYKNLLTLLENQVDSIVLNSILYKIGLYCPILAAALSSGQNMEETFKNLFDSEYHNTVEEFITSVQKALVDIYTAVKGSSTKDYALEKMFEKHINSDEETVIDLLYSILRTARFFREKRGLKNG